MKTPFTNSPADPEETDNVTYVLQWPDFRAIIYFTAAGAILKTPFTQSNKRMEQVYFLITNYPYVKYIHTITGPL